MKIKITIGKYKNSKIDFIKDMEMGMRPMKNIVVESIFNGFQNKMINKTVLDLFSCSGQLGIYALSAGAKHVIFNDNSKININLIQNNLSRINVPNKDFTISYLDCLDFLSVYRNEKFDFIFLDPPYANKYSQIIPFLIKNLMINKKGYIIYHCKKNEDNKQLLKLLLKHKLVYKNKIFGKTKIFIISF